MKIEKQIQERILILALDGDLIGQESGMKMLGIVNEEVVNESIDHCALDMSDIRYMDSSGIGVLLTIYNEFGNRTNGRMVLINPSDQVINILKITKLDTVFTVVNSRDKAVTELKG
jgi:anti-sigma B factor antagonist